MRGHLPGFSDTMRRKWAHIWGHLLFCVDFSEFMGARDMGHWCKSPFRGVVIENPLKVFTGWAHSRGPAMKIGNTSNPYLPSTMIRFEDSAIDNIMGPESDPRRQRYVICMGFTCKRVGNKMFAMWAIRHTGGRKEQLNYNPVTRNFTWMSHLVNTIFSSGFTDTAGDETFHTVSIDCDHTRGKLRFYADGKLVAAWSSTDSFRQVIAIDLGALGGGKEPNAFRGTIGPFFICVDVDWQHAGHYLWHADPYGFLATNPNMIKYTSGCPDGRVRTALAADGMIRTESASDGNVRADLAADGMIRTDLACDGTVRTALAADGKLRACQRGHP